jgi:mannosyl-3-phosphoglycerate synthase
VHEYVQEYCAGIKLAQSKYSMVRIAWHSKPKIKESGLFFAKRGRASERTNRILNELLSYYTGYGTEIIKTGNAGEHAMTMDLAKRLDFSSGYSIEPYHFINMLEKYGGILDNPESKIMNERIEIFQIESRNPHLHEVKGDEHVEDMSRAALEVIYRSPVCPDELKEEILTDLRERKLLKEGEEPQKIKYYPAIINSDLPAFKKALQNEEYASLLKCDLSKFKQQTYKQGLARDVQPKPEKLPVKNIMLEAK